MKKTKAFSLLVALAVSALLLSAANAQTIPEEARRHMARGQAAVEMAKSAEELEDAIQEFQEAIELAPDWPDPYYQLASLQEKSEKFNEAVASLKEYLRLAPNAPDAAKIQEQIYKLEYKAEQVLTVPDIIDVLVSLADGQTWQVVGDCDKNSDPYRRLAFKREGPDAVKLLKDELNYRYSPTYQTLKIAGPVLKYITTRNVADDSSKQELYKQGFGDITAVMEHEVEVVSKRLVKVKQKVLRAGVGNGAISDGQKFTCTFQKK